ncbi:hypothetical protein BDF14DRAFT_1959135 [Spinellus fusiger]|nr:hypothetical protein BDF14DRAFT_1959135 [Spinellus fusiger]
MYPLPTPYNSYCLDDGDCLVLSYNPVDMQQVHHRTHTPFQSDDTTALEDTVEFLDEQEQEKLLEELWLQNEKSNRFIQRPGTGGSLSVCNVRALQPTLVCLINHFPSYVAYWVGPSGSLSSGAPIIPIPTAIPQPSIISFPHLAVACSILSLYSSIYTLLNTCRLSLRELFSSISAHRGLGAPPPAAVIVTGCLGLTSPLMAFLEKTAWLEIGFWTIPLLVLLLDFSAVQMMRQVEANFGELDRARYKFKAV